MLSVIDIVETLPAHIVYAAPDCRTLTFSRFVAGDLMSDILVSVEAEYLLITSLATEQAIRTADVVCAAAVLLVNDKLPTPGMKAVAKESGITLLCTPLPMFEACAEISRMAHRFDPPKNVRY